MSSRSIFFFRLAALSLLIFLAAKPVVIRPEAGAGGHWAIFVDTSSSMRVQDPTSRFKRATDLAAQLAKHLPSPKLFTFSDGVHPINVKDLATLRPEGRLSNMAGAITDELNGGDYKAAIILSDGRQVGSGDPVLAAASAGRPLILVGVGNPAQFQDVAVRQIQGPPFAFKNIPTSLTATISIIGFAGKEIDVKLKEGERVLAIQQVKAAGPDVETTLTFSFTPTSLGSKTLTVEAGQYQGEITTLNNRKDLVLDVGRDRFRVLYICGEPGPEYSFLRHQFKSDPSVELVTFVILRNANNLVDVPETELSLIPFPTQDVLISQIPSFDLIVFEEFSYQLYGLLPNLLYAIRQKVNDGGSFLMIGGPQTLGQGSSYLLPGIKDMIPLDFGTADVTFAAEPAPFIVKAPAHPILRLDDNAERSARLWSALPPLKGTVLVPSARPGATVLGTVNVGGKERPVLAVWKQGKGRVGVMTTRSTWRWSMLSGQRENVSFAYQQFWKNMVLWLTRADDSKQVRVSLDAKRLRLGDADTIRVSVFDEYFKPLADADVRVEITHPDGTKNEVTAYMEVPGVYAVPFHADQLGDHDVWARASRRNGRVGEDRFHFKVVEGFSEDEDLRPQFSLLKEMAHATNGRFVTADEFTPALLDQLDADVSQKIGRKVLLWNSRWILLGLLGLLVTEWTIRRRTGLP